MKQGQEKNQPPHAVEKTAVKWKKYYMMLNQQNMQHGH